MLVLLSANHVYKFAVKVEYVCMSLIWVEDEFQFCIAFTENDNWPDVLFLNGTNKSPHVVGVISYRFILIITDHASYD